MENLPTINGLIIRIFEDIRGYVKKNLRGFSYISISEIFQRYRTLKRTARPKREQKAVYR
jgi:hypothetical protein